ncbi:DoxX family protein [Chondrinema litorale]|uniref:DoxX family protein n=1 Tax=Chondrinema litorale TaxID=2994555 RepID=UPI002543EA81|nr:DoxX family protein [Chondrinema litorale]UZR98379.1 DoxX family protein [Chondrinema litorale]
MNTALKLDQLHAKVKYNIWFKYFAVFNRIILAAGFTPSGFVKINNERFTALANNHPMGHYLEALYHTGYYYPFIGVMQITAAILLLIPRTATLGALIYFPIILNICILSFAVRFDGSLFTSPLMVLACLYLICWDYDKIKFILPFKYSTKNDSKPVDKVYSKKFPFAFFSGVFATMLIVVFGVNKIFDLYPRNSISECQKQCNDSDNPEACITFCECIYNNGESLDNCLEAYDNAEK